MQSSLLIVVRSVLSRFFPQCEIEKPTLIINYPCQVKTALNRELTLYRIGFINRICKVLPCVTSPSYLFHVAKICHINNINKYFQRKISIICNILSNHIEYMRILLTFAMRLALAHKKETTLVKAHPCNSASIVGVRTFYGRERNIEAHDALPRP